MTEFLVFADLHAHNFKEFDERTEDNASVRLKYITDALSDIATYAKLNKIDKILFAGDLFHVRARVNTLVYNKLFETIERITKVYGIEFIMIPGNHDQLDNSDYPEHSLRPFSAISGVTVLDRIEFYETPEFDILTVPYSKNAYRVIASIDEACVARGNVDKPAILLGHLGIDGGLVGKGNYAMADAFSVADLMPEYFAGVYLGHFHKYQLLGGYDHVMYAGAPIQHSFSDEGEKKGFIHVTLDNGKATSKFVPTDSYIPTFLTFKYPEQANDIMSYLHDSTSYYYRILVSEADVEKLSTFMPENSKYKLEIVREYKEQERTEVKVGMSFEEIVATYAEEHNPEAKELGLEILKKASENRV